MADTDTVIQGTRDGGGARAKAAGLKQQASRYALLPVRIFLGVTFVYASIDKFTDGHFFAGASDPSSFESQTQAVKSVSPIEPLLDLALKAPTGFAVAIAIGELLAGLGVLLGLWTRIAALGGALINLSLFLTVSWQVEPYYLGNDLPYLMLWLPLVLAGAPLLSADSWLAARSARLRAARTGPGARRTVTGVRPEI